MVHTLESYHKAHYTCPSAEKAHTRRKVTMRHRERCLQRRSSDKPNQSSSRMCNQKLMERTCRSEVRRMSPFNRAELTSCHNSYSPVLSCQSPAPRSSHHPRCYCGSPLKNASSTASSTSASNARNCRGRHQIQKMSNLPVNSCSTIQLCWPRRLQSLASEYQTHKGWSRL